LIFGGKGGEAFMIIVLGIELVLFVVLLLANIVASIFFPPLAITFIAFAAWYSSWNARKDRWT